MRSMLHSLGAVVVLFGTLVAVAARGAPVCEASPEVRAAIEVADMPLPARKDTTHLF